MKKFFLLFLIIATFATSCQKDVFYNGTYNVIINGSFYQNGNTVNQQRTFALEIVSKTNDSIEFVEVGNANNSFKIEKKNKTVSGIINVEEIASDHYYGPITIDGSWFNNSGDLLIVADMSYESEITNALTGQTEIYLVKGKCEIIPE